MDHKRSLKLDSDSEQDGDDDESEKGSEAEPEEEIFKNELTYKIGNYEYTLLRSKEKLDDIDPAQYYQESQVIVGANQ